MTRTPMLAALLFTVLAGAAPGRAAAQVPIPWFPQPGVPFPPRVGWAPPRPVGWPLSPAPLPLPLVPPAPLWQIGPVPGSVPPMPPVVPRFGLSETVASDIAQDAMDAVCPSGCGTIRVTAGPTSQGAVVIPLGPRLSQIVFDADTLGMIADRFGEDAIFAVFAHEIGHHVDVPQAPWFDSSWNRELRADAVAGCAVARAGRNSLAAAEMLTAMSMVPTPSHPSWHLRLQAFKRGLTECQLGETE